MSLIDLELDERFEQSYTVSFRVPATDLKTQNLVEDAKLTFEGDDFYITDVIKQRGDEVADYEILAEAAWMKLTDLKRPASFILAGETPRNGLAKILLDSGWSVLATTDDPLLYRLEAQDATILDLIWQWAKICLCEVSFQNSTKTVSMIPMVGAVRPLSFRYGRNLKSVKRTSKPPQVTRLYVYGKNGVVDITHSTVGGVDYIEDYSYYTNQGLTLPEAKALYRKDEIYSDDSFVEEAALFQAASARLAVLAQPIVLYEASVIDLSNLVGIPEYNFSCGDTVNVFDEILGFDVQARVTRKITWPFEPDKDKIELTFGGFILPDPKVTTTRSDTSQNWELFESRNWVGQKLIRNFSTILHRIRLSTFTDAEWITTFKLQGVGAGSSTVTFTFLDDETGLKIWDDYVVGVSNGEAIDVNWSFGQKGIPAGVTTMVIRARSDTGSAGIDVAELNSAFWILARGSARQEVSLANSVRYDYIGSVQSFTVPDDVTEIQIEAVGGSGRDVTYGGKGGHVVAKFPVLGGDSYDIYVGGNEPGTTGGWPNGGTGYSQIANPTGGGSSSHIIPAGGSFTDALIVAAGAGGSGESDTIGPPGFLAYGGDGGFYNGTVGAYETPGYAGFGATQDALGPGGVTAPNPGENGDTDGLGFGGDAGISSNFFAFGGGGGGGGWHGGGGAGGLGVSPGYTGGGGGASGFLASIGYDLQYDDGFNPSGQQGYIIISWATPI